MEASDKSIDITYVKKGIVYERCVLCGAETSVPIDTPIENRAAYVEGAGQLCDRCYAGIYGTADTRTIS